MTEEEMWEAVQQSDEESVKNALKKQACNHCNYIDYLL